MIVGAGVVVLRGVFVQTQVFLGGGGGWVGRGLKVLRGVVAAVEGVEAVDDGPGVVVVVGGA